MEMMVMELGGLACPSCLEKIQQAVENQAGVAAVKVLFNAGKLKAKYRPDQVSADQLGRVVENLGYEVKGIKTKEEITVKQNIK